MTHSFVALPEALLAQASAQDDLPLASLLTNDLQAHWNAGQPLSVEDYLRRIPALNQRPEVLLDLIYTEWLLREQFGPIPTLEEYRGRFPALADKLERLLSLHGALSQNEVAILPPTPVRAGLVEPPTLPPGVAANTDTLPPIPVDAQATQSPADSTPLDPEASRHTSKTLAAQPSVQVPGYEILGELGRGGMGVVYKARHLQLNRIVALKMVLAAGHAGSADRSRFLTEAEAVAALQHPNIVQVFDFGQHDGLPYMALEYVNGGSLNVRLRDGLPLPLEAAWLVEQLARGMAAAHAKGIIHRDLKPANVLLSTPQGSNPEQAALQLCTPKVTDFGLAKKVEGGSGLTQTGAIMGTPS